MRIGNVLTTTLCYYKEQLRDMQSRLNVITGKTDIDGKIDDFRQGTTANCYMLTRLRNMSRKSWGKQAIKSAITPDGMGGAYITFRGATDRSGQLKPAQFHVSVESILNVRAMQQKYPDPNNYKLSTESGQRQYEQDLLKYKAYSQGDDDVLAVELAYEKYLKSKGRNMGDPDRCSFLSNDSAEITDDGDIIRLIRGSNESGYRGARFGTTNPVKMDCALSEIKGKMDDYALEIAFKKDNKLGLPSDHSIEIVAIGTDSSGRPLIELRNPWNSSKSIKKGYYDVLLEAQGLLVWENPDKKTNLSQRINFATTTQSELDNLYALQKKYQHKPGRVTVKNGGWH